MTEDQTRLSNTKRKHSKTGCISCKTRKVKCSEEVPKCFNCTRLSKDCVYLSLEEQKAQRRQRKLLKKLKSHSMKVISNVKSLNSVKDRVSKAIKGNVLLPDEALPIHSSENIIHQNGVKVVKDSSTNPELSILEDGRGTLPVELSDNNCFSNIALLDSVFSDVNKLAIDLTNDISGNMLFQSSLDVNNRKRADQNLSPVNSETLNNNASTLSDSNIPIDDDFKYDFTVIHKQILGNFVDRDKYSSYSSFIYESSSWEALGKKLEAIGIPAAEIFYLILFHEKVSFWILPFAESSRDNIVNKIMFYYVNSQSTSKETFSRNCLTSALMAVAAKYAYNATGEIRHKLDQEKYLKRTITNLSNEFNDNVDADALMAQKIESLVLSILLLAMYSSSSNIDWKIHLQGAKDIFLRYSKITLTDFKREETLALSKVWFTAFDLIANLLSDDGGCTSNDEELDSLSDFNSNEETKEVLINMKILTTDRYNLLLGYSDDVLTLEKLVIRYIRRGKNKGVINTDNYNNSFYEIIHQAQISRKYRFHVHEFGKILDFGRKDLGFFEKSVLYKIQTDEWYSLFDACHQIHLDACIIIFFRNVRLEKTELLNNCVFSMQRYFEFMFMEPNSELSSTTSLYEDFFHVIDDITSGGIKSFDDLKKKHDFTPFMIKELRMDLRLMMFLSSATVYGISIVDAIEDEAVRKIEMCKNIAYFQVLNQDCGCEGAKTSFDLILNKWQHGITSTNTLAFA